MATRHIRININKNATQIAELLDFGQTNLWCPTQEHKAALEHDLLGLESEPSRSDSVVFRAASM